MNQREKCINITSKLTLKELKDLKHVLEDLRDLSDWKTLISKVSIYFEKSNPLEYLKDVKHPAYLDYKEIGYPPWSAPGIHSFSIRFDSFNVGVDYAIIIQEEDYKDYFKLLLTVLREMYRILEMESQSNLHNIELTGIQIVAYKEELLNLPLLVCNKALQVDIKQLKLWELAYERHMSQWN